MAEARHPNHPSRNVAEEHLGAWMVSAARPTLTDSHYTKSTLDLTLPLKSRDITLPTKFHIVKAMVFPVVTCRCETWTIKKVEHRRTDAFELWCWRRLLRVPWTARRSNQSILKEINPEYSLEDWCQSWSSNTLGTGCKEPIHWKKPWCWKDWRQKEEGEAEDEMVR